MTTRKFAVLGLLLSAGVAIVLLAHSERPAPTPEPETSTQATVEASVVDQAPAQSPAPSLPSQGWEHPLMPNLAAWREAARRDPAEALALADRLWQCWQTLGMPADVQKSAFERRRRAAVAAGEAVSVLQRLDALQVEEHARRIDCSGLDPDYFAEMLAWTERAARRAESSATRSAMRLAYVHRAFLDFPREADILARLDEAQRRRDLARAWLVDELESGNERALPHWLNAISGSSPVFPEADPVTRHAWMFVESLRHARRSGGAEAAQALWEDPQGSDWYTGDLTPEQIAAAIEAGREHHLRLFGPPGG